MVTSIEVGQLSGECTLWLDTLRAFRAKFQNFKNQLLEAAVDQTQKDVLLEIEHFDNQFHIQLINIHDLKHAVKRHLNKISAEHAVRKGQLPDELPARHEHLYDEYQQLDTNLHLIAREFERFLRYVLIK